jgi:hypothetical protein
MIPAAVSWLKQEAQTQKSFIFERSEYRDEFTECCRRIQADAAKTIAATSNGYSEAAFTQALKVEQILLYKGSNNNTNLF